MDVPDTAAALRTLAELLDDDVSESTEDGAAAATATGAWDSNTAAGAVDDAAEDEGFGPFPAGRAAETQTAEMAKSTAWSFILSKRTCVQRSMLEYSI